jgi:hypothetical protein
MSRIHSIPAIADDNARWSTGRFFATVLFTCRRLDVASALQFTRDYFGTVELEHNSF